jgi:hypothetical protein
MPAAGQGERQAKVWLAAGKPAKGVFDEVAKRFRVDLSGSGHLEIQYE